MAGTSIRELCRYWRERNGQGGEGECVTGVDGLAGGEGHAVIERAGRAGTPHGDMRDHLAIGAGPAGPARLCAGQGLAAGAGRREVDGRPRGHARHVAGAAGAGVACVQLDEEGCDAGERGRAGAAEHVQPSVSRVGGAEPYGHGCGPDGPEHGQERGHHQADHSVTSVSWSSCRWACAQYWWSPERCSAATVAAGITSAVASTSICASIWPTVSTPACRGRRPRPAGPPGCAWPAGARGQPRWRPGLRVWACCTY